jgi:hypothetical protein
MLRWLERVEYAAWSVIDLLIDWLLGHLMTVVYPYKLYNIKWDVQMIINGE